MPNMKPDFGYPGLADPERDRKEIASAEAGIAKCNEKIAELKGEIANRGLALEKTEQLILSSQSPEEKTNYRNMKAVQEAGLSLAKSELSKWKELLKTAEDKLISFKAKYN